MSDDRETLRERVWEAIGYWEAVSDIVEHLRVASDGRPLDLDAFNRAIVAMGDAKHPREKIMAECKRFTGGKR